MDNKLNNPFVYNQSDEKKRYSVSSQNKKITARDYQRIKEASLNVVQSLLIRWLPNGRLCGHEYIALNPKRSDTKLGSFKVNVCNGKWADFATGDKGGDLISLAAYLSGKSQSQAAIELAEMLGVCHG